jgi:hypothetical protein
MFKFLKNLFSSKKKIKEVDKTEPIKFNGNVEIYPTKWNMAIVARNKTKLYVFGDNLDRKGNKGQACIRNCRNSIGLATKNYNSNEPIAYWSDNELQLNCQIIEQEIDNIIKTYNEFGYKSLVFSYFGYGNGVADLPKRAPETFNYLKRRLFEVFSFEWE